MRQHFTLFLSASSHLGCADIHVTLLSSAGCAHGLALRLMHMLSPIPFCARGDPLAATMKPPRAMGLDRTLAREASKKYSLFSTGLEKKPPPITFGEAFIAPCGRQVQDVSLIFQSAMATSIAAMCAAAGYAPEEALGTTLVTLVIATFVAGVLIMLVGARALLRVHGLMRVVRS